MKLEVGMYVRTEAGYIGKISGLDYRFEGDGNELSNIDGIYFDKCINEIEKDIYSTCFYIFKNARISHNLIDLIEVGDYVNGERVSKIREYDVITDNNVWPKQEIESIVTKERFESVNYKVGE